MSRSALVAIASLGSACTSATPLYGAPVPADTGSVVDSATKDSAVQDTASDVNDTGGNVNLYGAPADPDGG
jgi:hypothetical protein